jgi:hypothetical protein
MNDKDENVYDTFFRRGSISIMYHDSLASATSGIKAVSGT